MSGAAGDEFALIDRILARLGDACARDILVPPGDDAAAWIPAGGAVVVTTDTLVEGSDWRPDTMALADVGWRGVAAALSDLAAMGAAPQHVLVAAMLGPALTIEQLDEFVDGMAAACRAHEVTVAGGDVSRAATTAFTLTACGAARLDRAGRAIVLRRDAARPGDVVAVSGHPGAAAAGLAIIQARREEAAAAPLLQAHRRPVARIALGQAAVTGGVPCAIDISDGLVQDLGHIARRSKVGIEVALDALPLAPAAVELLGVAAARDFALSGGDDYELAFAGRAEAIASIGITRIGRVVEDHPGQVVVRQLDGAPYEPPQPGWDPFRARPLREA